MLSEDIAFIYKKGVTFTALSLLLCLLTANITYCAASSSSEGMRTDLTGLSVDDLIWCKFYISENQVFSLENVLVALDQYKKQCAEASSVQSETTVQTLSHNEPKKEVPQDYISNYKSYLETHKLTGCCIVNDSPVLDTKIKASIIAGYPEALQRQIRLAEPILKTKYAERLLKLFIVHGPLGVGKSALGTVLAIETKRPLLNVRVGLVESYRTASESKELDKIFEPIIQTKDPWVVLFDDMYTMDEKSSSGKSNYSSSIFLQRVLDRNINPNLTLVATTKHISDIAERLIRVCINNLYEISLPDLSVRKQIGKLYFDQEQMKYSDVVLDYFAKNTEGFSGREIMEIVESVRSLITTEIIDSVPVWQQTSAYIEALFDKQTLVVGLKHLDSSIDLIINNLSKAGIHRSVSIRAWKEAMDSKKFHLTIGYKSPSVQSEDYQGLQNTELSRFSSFIADKATYLSRLRRHVEQESLAPLLIPSCSTSAAVQELIDRCSEARDAQNKLNQDSN